MLMRFSVSNFLSFGYREDEDGSPILTEFHMYAGRSEQFQERVIQFRKRFVRKFSALYGANASGKTNLISAIDCGRHIVTHTLENSDIEECYCKSRLSNREKPTTFEYEFTIGERCFAYGFSAFLNEKKILSEWLYEMNNTKEKVIFERDAVAGEYFFDEKLFGEKDEVMEFHFFLKDVNRIQNSLLIYEIERRNLRQEAYQLFSRIFNWFESGLSVIYPDTRIAESYIRFASDNQRLISLLDYFDTGITGYHMQKINEAAFREYFLNASVADKILEAESRSGASRVRSVLRYNNTLFEIEYRDGRVDSIHKLLFQHGADDNFYEYGEESDGTRRLIEILDVILNDAEDKVFLIDELDRSLHPQMTRKFVETFLKFTEENNTQLIITTHESALMDLNILRRDEIWFAERENDNSTSLSTLEKFKIRYDKVVNKAYLAGRYGAVPVFKDLKYVLGEEN